MLRRVLFPLVLCLMLALFSVGCGGADCNDPCDHDSDCGGDLICFSSQCTPSKCRSECSGTIQICYFNRLTCRFISC